MASQKRSGNPSAPTPDLSSTNPCRAFAELGAQIARGRDRFFRARAVRREETDLPAARGFDLGHLERATGHEAELAPLFKRPAERAQQRCGLTGRRKHGALDAQGPGVLAIESQLEAERGEAVACERRGDLVDDHAQREHELLARADSVIPRTPNT